MTTTEESSHCEIYQFHILLLQISPAIWRRILIRNDSSVADLHHVLQIVMGWNDTHLHRFALHGKEYGIAQSGGIWFRDDPAQIRLADLHMRRKERFLYEYDQGVTVFSLLSAQQECNRESSFLRPDLSEA